MATGGYATYEDALNLARQHRARGNLIAADRTYRDILESVGETPEVLHEHGLTCYFRGAVQEAYRQTKRATELEPTTALYHANHAIMANTMGRAEEAFASWDAAIAADPRMVDAYSNSAKALVDHGYPELAEQRARQALELLPDHGDAAVNLGMALQAQGDLQGAVAIWEDLHERRGDHATCASNLANAYRDLGRADDAERMSAVALNLDPNNPVAHNNYGNTLLDKDNVEEAISHFERAIDLDIQYVSAYNNVGVALLAADRPEESVRWHRFALALDPEFVLAHHHLSNALHQIGDLGGAEAAAKQAILLAPEKLQYHISLAEMLLTADRADEAESVLNQALDLERDSAESYRKLANALQRLNRIEEAEDAARQAIALQPEQPASYQALSNVFFGAGRIEDAIGAAQDALACAPNFARGHAWLANLYSVLGDHDTAERYAREALSRNRFAVGAYMTLTGAKKVMPDDRDLAAMEGLLDEVRSSTMRMSLQYALGKAYEDTGQVDAAFDAYHDANSLKRRGLAYNAQANARSVENTKRIYSRDTLDELSGAGPDSPVPVFIVGMPRSGTTLTEQILAAHPAVHGAGELTLMPRHATEIGGTPTRERVAQVGDAYLAAIQERAPEAERITDKMPGNYQHLGLIASALPNATLIHVRRDPVDTCWSCFKQNFARGQHWSYDLRELGQQYRLYADIMAHWREVLGERLVEIDYEELVGDIESAARRLVAAAGLPWDDRCLAFYEADRPVMTASKSQVRQPIYGTSVAKWRKYEHRLQPLLDELGELVPPHPEHAAEASGG